MFNEEKMNLLWTKAEDDLDWMDLCWETSDYENIKLLKSEEIVNHSNLTQEAKEHIFSVPYF